MDRKAVVADFLRKCIDYANASIERKQQRGQDDLIPAWQSYIEFTQHAIDEIHTGKLDSWFDREPRVNLSENLFGSLKTSLFLMNLLFL